MKRLTAVVATCLMLASMGANAETGAVAVLDVQQALLASDAATSFREELKKEFEGEERQLVDLEKQARALREKMQKNAGLSSDEEMNQLRMQFQKAFGEYQRRGQELQQQRAQREQAFVSEMKPQLDKIIREMIEQEDIALIVQKQAVIYAQPGLDITSKVVELLNKQ